MMIGRRKELSRVEFEAVRAAYGDLVLELSVGTLGTRAHKRSPLRFTHIAPSLDNFRGSSMMCAARKQHCSRANARLRGQAPSLTRRWNYAIIGRSKSHVRFLSFAPGFCKGPAAQHPSESDSRLVVRRGERLPILFAG